MHGLFHHGAQSMGCKRRASMYARALVTYARWLVRLPLLIFLRWVAAHGSDG